MPQVHSHACPVTSVGENWETRVRRDWLCNQEPLLEWGQGQGTKEMTSESLLLLKGQLTNGRTDRKACDWYWRHHGL